MKRILALVILITCLGISACNDGSDKKTEPVSAIDTISAGKASFPWIIKILDNFCEKAGGMGNFIIDSANADTMIKHFDAVYGKYSNESDIVALQREYWIDSCTIYALASFLKTSSSKYDGVRIQFGASTINESTYAAPYQNKTSIFIYPTGKSAKGHADSTHILIPTPACTAASPYLESYATAGPKIAVFEKKYHQNSPAPANPANYSLSKGIWIDSCVIYFMANLIKGSAGLLDGIRVHTAAYKGTETRLPLGATAKQASTIIMVPTSPNGANHTDNWSVIKAVIIYLKEKFQIMDAGLNHGELCPQKCD